MKKTTKLASTLLITITLLGGTAALAADESFGSIGASNDTDYTLEEMLNYAIEDEYMAKAEYEAIINEFGSGRPFTNLINAEKTHIELLLPLFENYGFVVPEDIAQDKVLLPETLEETYSIGVEAELNNIEMYQIFLEEDLPEDVEIVFAQLAKASENHLKAFQNVLERTENGYLGYGRMNTKGQGANANRETRLSDGTCLYSQDGLQQGSNNGLGTGRNSRIGR